MLVDIPLGQQVILADASVLTISEVKRYLPNRRVVCKGIWHNQSVFAKLFIGKNAAKYAQRDKVGVIALSQASINTPALLKEIAIADNQGLALIFEVIEPAPNAEELWQVLNPSSRLALMRQLVEAVAQHHQNIGRRSCCRIQHHSAHCQRRSGDANRLRTRRHH